VGTASSCPRVTVERGEKDKKRGEVLVGIPINRRGHIKRAHPTWLPSIICQTFVLVLVSQKFLLFASPAKLAAERTPFFLEMSPLAQSPIYISVFPTQSRLPTSGMLLQVFQQFRIFYGDSF